MECRRTTVETEFEKDPQGVAGVIAALPDPIEQAALIEQLAHAYPQSKEALCAYVPRRSPAAERCKRMELRPHLYSRSMGTSDPHRRRKASGPSTGAVPKAGKEPSWSLSGDEKALRKTCGQDAACLVKQAEAAARTGDDKTAGQSCVLAWPDGSAARDECMFQASEALVQKGGWARLYDGIALCGLAGQLEASCIQHILVDALPPVTTADNPDREAVLGLTTATESLVDEYGRRVGGLYAQYLMSVWTRESFANASSITGHLIQMLPNEAHPHVRMAAAWRLVGLQGTERGIEQLAGTIHGGLMSPVSNMASADSARAYVAKGRSRRPSSMWGMDQKNDGTIVAIYALGAGRRTTVGDPADDTRIAVLEAAARLKGGVHPSFFYQVVGTEYAEKVRWTGARLGAAVQAEYPHFQRPSASLDSSRLVQEYLAPVQGFQRRHGAGE